MFSRLFFKDFQRFFVAGVLSIGYSGVFYGTLNMNLQTDALCSERHCDFPPSEAK